MEIKTYYGYMTNASENTIKLFENENRNNGELICILTLAETSDNVTCKDINNVKLYDVIEFPNNKKFAVIHINYVL